MIKSFTEVDENEWPGKQKDSLLRLDEHCRMMCTKWSINHLIRIDLREGG
jgi:hypothetical protein